MVLLSTLILSDEMSNFLNDSWLAFITFLVEGVILLTVASVGLVGNILSFIVLNTQGLQKTFHKLLLLLNIFDMVSTSISKHTALQSFDTDYYLQVYLLTAVSLFALPTLWPSVFSGTYQTLTLPYVLPIAHVGLVSITYDHK